MDGSERLKKKMEKPIPYKHVPDSMKPDFGFAVRFFPGIALFGIGFNGESLAPLFLFSIPGAWLLYKSYLYLEAKSPRALRDRAREQQRECYKKWGIDIDKPE